MYNRKSAGIILLFASAILTILASTLVFSETLSDAASCIPLENEIPALNQNCYTPVCTGNEYTCHITCSKDSDCGISKWFGGDFCLGERNLFSYRQSFKCVSPGTISSYCANSFSALLKQDCGTDHYDQEYYCKENSVYLKKGNYYQGCKNNKCFSSNSSEEKLIETCLYGCNKGKCIEKPAECCKDSDCKADYSSDNYCMGNKVYQDFHDFFCKDSKCSEKINTKLIEECSGFCLDGECAEATCKKNSYCGIDGFTGEKSCKEDNVFQDYRSFTCKFPGTANSSCSSSITSKIVQECPYGCLNGKCIEKPAECCKDSDCGISSSELICVGNEVYNQTKTFSCLNGKCESETKKAFVESCFYKCQSGECIKKKKDSSHIKITREKNYCGDGFCDSGLGEDEFNCNNDCEIDFIALSAGNRDSGETGLINDTDSINLVNKLNPSQGTKNTYLIPIILGVLSIILIIILIIVLIARR